MTFLKSTMLAAALFITTIPSAKADEATAKLFTTHAYGAGLASGIGNLETALAANSKNGEAIFGLGALQFFHAIEGLQQDLFRYGAGNQGAGRSTRRSFLPVLRVPVPPNPNAEVASYEKVRGIFSKFVERLQMADKTLAKMGDTPAKLPFNILKIRYDINGDGTVEDNESLVSLLATLSGGNIAVPPDEKAFELAFDTADAHWLRGYTNVLMSLGNFFLSFDFEKSYDASFHTVFGLKATKFGRSMVNAQGSKEEIAAIVAKIEAIEKKKEALFAEDNNKRLRQLRTLRNTIRRDKKRSNAERDIELGKTKAEYDQLDKARRESRKLDPKKRQLQQQLAAFDPSSGGGGNWMQEVFDPVSFLHSISWDVVEPDRLKTVRQNLLTVMRLNRTTWRLVQAETDNDREWLPNPNQKSPFPGMEVTQEIIDGWLKSVDTAEAILEGKLLTPHLRFGRGVNMKRFFEEAKSFDLVLFLTGPNSIQYVEKGPIADQRLLRTLSQPFGRNFGAYAIWFN